ncbi:hypothetical protein P4O66_001609 [Electrophorus voltai]|uniref:Uncharacterized protein n=1 Tax=Electrophorus voltai TaxID=2609070 RepID=A0AAD8Z7L3_9TELE|nr:hypothetical protein P4O66_001609 [Electrophorus voltai]
MTAHYLKLNPSKTELLFIPDSSFVTYEGFDPFFCRKLPRIGKEGSNEMKNADPSVPTFPTLLIHKTDEGPIDRSLHASVDLLSTGSDLGLISFSE